MSQWINKVNFDMIVLHRKTQERAGKCLGEHYHGGTLSFFSQGASSEHKFNE